MIKILKFMKNKMILILLIAAACESENMKKENSSMDYITFGHFYGECGGDKCVQIYKLTDSSLYEDTEDEYPSFDEPYNGNYVQLQDSLFEKVKKLKNEIPDKLLTINTKVIGQPDAGDWGGLYFEIAYQGERRFWLIDKMKSNVPEDLSPFVDKLNENIKLLND